MLLFHGMMKVKPGTRQEFIDKLNAADVEARFSAEPGNVFYSLAMSATDDDVVVTCDCWETREAFEAHTASPACGEFMALHDEYVIQDFEPRIYEF